MLDWAVQMADLGCLAAIETGDWDWALATQARFDEQPISAGLPDRPRRQRRDDPRPARQPEPARRHRGARTDRSLRPIRRMRPPSTTPAHGTRCSLAISMAPRRSPQRGRGRARRRAATGADAPRPRPAVGGDADGLRDTLAEIDAARATGRAAAVARSTLAAGLAALDGSVGAAGDVRGCRGRVARAGLCHSISRSACSSGAGSRRATRCAEAATRPRSARCRRPHGAGRRR